MPLNILMSLEATLVVLVTDLVHGAVSKDSGRHLYEQAHFAMLNRRVRYITITPIGFAARAAAD